VFKSVLEQWEFFSTISDKNLILVALAVFWKLLEIKKKFEGHLSSISTVYAIFKLYSTIAGYPWLGFVLRIDKLEV